MLEEVACQDEKVFCFDHSPSCPNLSSPDFFFAHRYTFAVHFPYYPNNIQMGQVLWAMDCTIRFLSASYFKVYHTFLYIPEI